MTKKTCKSAIRAVFGKVSKIEFDALADAEILSLARLAAVEMDVDLSDEEKYQEQAA